MLAFAVSVKGRGVIIPDSRIPSGLQGILGLGFAYMDEELAERGAAETESAQLDTGSQRTGGKAGCCRILRFAVRHDGHRGTGCGGYDRRDVVRPVNTRTRGDDRFNIFLDSCTISLEDFTPCEDVE